MKWQTTGLMNYFSFYFGACCFTLYYNNLPVSKEMIHKERGHLISWQVFLMAHCTIQKCFIYTCSGSTSLKPATSLSMLRALIHKKAHLLFSLFCCNYIAMKNKKILSTRKKGGFFFHQQLLRKSQTYCKDKINRNVVALRHYLRRHFVE